MKPGRRVSRGRAPEGAVSVFRSSVLALAILCPRGAAADDSPKHAERGVQAYRAGKHVLARMFFDKALQDATLKGREDWAVLATLNLVDLDLEAMEEQEAERRLGGLTARDPGLRTLVLWKRSQVSFQRRRYDRAIAQVDSALRLAGKDRARETALRLDRLRYLVHSRGPEDWAAELAALRLRLPGGEAARLAAVV